MKVRTMSTLYTILFMVLFIRVSVATKCLCDDFRELKQLIESKTEEVKQRCDKRYRELENKLNTHISRRAGPGGIAFSAQLTLQKLNLPIGTTITLNKVFINDRSGYNNKTGVFTAPEEGVYMFTYFIGNGNTVGQSWVGLMHNGQRINSAVTDPFHHSQDLQGGNVALVRMRTGDRAWIESFHQNGAYLDGHHKFSSFSGVYLYY